MAARGEATQVTIYLDPRTVERIDEWAEKLGQTRSKMTRCLVEEAIIECGLEYDILTSAPGIAIINVLRSMTGKPPINLYSKSPVEGLGRMAPA